LRAEKATDECVISLAEHENTDLATSDFSSEYNDRLAVNKLALSFGAVDA
jgi:hypothetical protein